MWGNPQLIHQLRRQAGAPCQRAAGGRKRRPALDLNNEEI
jgi:hypothetical protein